MAHNLTGLFFDLSWGKKKETFARFASVAILWPNYQSRDFTGTGGELAQC